MGRPKLIETPEIMYNLFNEYREQVKASSFKITDWVGGQGKEVQRKKEKPLTLEGFENYAFDKGIIVDMGDYFSNKEGRYTDFAAICTRIKKIIRQDQIEGGMAGIYSTSITQRLNGLVEKSENKSEITEIIIRDGTTGDS